MALSRKGDLSLLFEILDWADIKNDFDGTIVLGNGASIAVDDHFAYGSLKQHATENGFLTTDVQKIFEFFKTDDFELILRIVWQATNVNKALNIEDKQTEAAYQHVRDCLIAAVRDIHSEHEAIKNQIPRIYNFLKGFKKVISLNYDLIVYWTMMYGNDIPDHHAFKDCFLSGSFDDDWRRFEEPIGNQNECTLVFYPHGSLVFARDKIENERKINSGQEGLLEGILKELVTGHYVPLFVSEGTSEQKVKSIQSSYYLNTVYREVLTSLNSNLVLYGWGLGEHDLHILKRMVKSRIDQVAVSVYGNDQAYCNRIHQIFKDYFRQPCNIVFFDSQSQCCWNIA